MLFCTDIFMACLEMMERRPTASRDQPRVNIHVFKVQRHLHRQVDYTRLILRAKTFEIAYLTGVRHIFHRIV